MEGLQTHAKDINNWSQKSEKEKRAEEKRPLKKGKMTPLNYSKKLNASNKFSNI
jgi:hypothetical protein